MSTDGLNPFMNNSTWPIVLTILNLPPWLCNKLKYTPWFCNKQKYIMLTCLISGPQQPKNDIDPYFKPLVENLKLL
jgi:hypothetical protein